MSTRTDYAAAVQAYADGVRVLFAPSGVPTGERGERGPTSFGSLATQAEQLVPVSSELTEATVPQLAAAEPLTRIRAENRLLSKALSDLEIGGYLLQAALDEEDDLNWMDEAGGERSSLSGGTIEEYLNLLLDEQVLDLQAFERSKTVTVDVKSAHSELICVIEDTFATILERTAEITRVALSGLAGLGITAVAQAAGTAGMNIAQALDQAENLSHLYRLAGSFAGKAYDALLALLGPQLAEKVGQQVLEWLGKFKEGEQVAQLLAKLYETQRIERELRQIVAESQVPLAVYATTIFEVDQLESAFRRNTALVDKVLPKLRYLRFIPASASPMATLLLAATYIILTGFVIVAGADYIDAQSFQPLNRVPGVRFKVESSLLRV